MQEDIQGNLAANNANHKIYVDVNRLHEKFKHGDQVTQCLNSKDLHHEPLLNSMWEKQAI